MWTNIRLSTLSREILARPHYWVPLLVYLIIPTCALDGNYIVVDILGKRKSMKYTSLWVRIISYLPSSGATKRVYGVSQFCLVRWNSLKRIKIHSYNFWLKFEIEELIMIWSWKNFSIFVSFSLSSYALNFF